MWISFSSSQEKAVNTGSSARLVQLFYVSSVSGNLNSRRRPYLQQDKQGPQVGTSHGALPQDEITTYVEKWVFLLLEAGIRWRHHIHQSGCRAHWWRMNRAEDAGGRPSLKRSKTRRVIKCPSMTKAGVNYKIKLSEDFVRAPKGCDCRWPP